MTNTQISTLNELIECLTDRTLFCTKEVLTSSEAARYMGIAKSYLYKLTMNREIPHYKSPTGKLCFFNRLELEAWLQQNRIATMQEIQSEANSYNAKGGAKC